MKFNNLYNCLLLEHEARGQKFELQDVRQNYHVYNFTEDKGMGLTILKFLKSSGYHERGCRVLAMTFAGRVPYYQVVVPNSLTLELDDIEVGMWNYGQKHYKNWCKRWVCPHDSDQYFFQPGRVAIGNNSSIEFYDIDVMTSYNVDKETKDSWEGILDEI
jgi:hypothetical protein